MAKALGFDLRPYLEQVPRTGEEFWLRLREGVLGFLAEATDEIWRTVPLADRYPTLCLRDDHRDDLIRFQLRRDERGPYFPTDTEDGVVTLSEAYLDGMTYRPQAGLLVLAPADLRLRARLTGWSWQGHTLVLEGHAYITNVAFEEGGGLIEAAADTGVHRVPFDVTHLSSGSIDLQTKDAWNSYRGSGFRASLDCTRLLTVDPAATWVVRLQVNCAGVGRSGTFDSRDHRTRAAAVPVAPDDAHGRWHVGFADCRGVYLRYRRRVRR